MMRETQLLEGLPTSMDFVSRNGMLAQCSARACGPNRPIFAGKCANLPLPSLHPDLDVFKSCLLHGVVCATLALLVSITFKLRRHGGVE